MKKKFFLSSAWEVDWYGQSDELYLLNHNGKIVGCSSEFELCTFDIALANSQVDHSKATWFGFDGVNLQAPATLEEIEAAGLRSFVIGYRKRWDLSEPIYPLETLIE